MRELLAVALMALGCAAASAQEAWKPEKNVEVVAGVSAGGNMDRTARSIQAIFQEKKLVVTFSSFRVVVGPKGLTPQQVAYWDQVFSRLVAADEWKADMERFHWVANYLNGEKTGEFLRVKNQELRRVYAEIGMAK